MTEHLPPQRIRDHLADRLDDDASAAVDAHLRDCPECVELLRRIESEAEGGGIAAGPEESERLNDRFREMARVFRGAERNCRYDAPPEVPGYVIGDFLGQGGMGAVWAAYREDSGKAVALKFIARGEFASAEDIVRFYKEAQAAKEIAAEARDGMAVVPVLDIGEVGDIHYIAMALADEGSLLDRIRGQPRDFADRPREAARLFETLARTLHRLHTLSPPLFHRDIKPENILLQRRGPGPARHGVPTPLSDLDPLFSDFGLAKRQGDSAGTMTGHIIGTPSYMAPEQIRNAREPTPAMEVYALGASLFHALTGEVPFKAESPFDVLKRAESEYPQFPRRTRGSLPAGLRAICLKCLEKDPARRYPSAEALADDLRRYLDADPADPVRARGPGMVERTRRWVRTNPVPTAVIALLAVVAGAASYSVWLQGQVARAQAQRLHENLVASARDLARRGDWAAALRSYGEAIDDGAPDRNRLRVERLFGFPAVNDGATLAREIDELALLDDLGPMAAPFDLARGAYLLTDFTRQEEGRKLVARALLREADLNLSPADPTFARALMETGQRKAVGILREAVRLDPLHFSANTSLVVALVASGNLQEAREHCRLMQGFFPRSPIPDFFLALVNVAEGDLPAMRANLDRFAKGIGPEQARHVERLRAYCGRLAKVLDLMENFEAMNGVGSPLTQFQLGLQSIGLATEAAAAIGPFAFPVPTVGLLYETLRILPGLWLQPGKLAGDEGFRRLNALREDFPDALVLVLLINNRLMASIGRINAGDLDGARALFDEVARRSEEALDAPTLLPRSPIRYQCRVLASIVDVSTLKVTRGEDLPAARRLRDNLHRMVSDGRRWPQVRARGLELFLNMLTVDMTREQLVAWQPDTPEGKAAYRARCRRLFLLARSLAEDWQSETPADPAPAAWLKRLDDWDRAQKSREPVYFAPAPR